jgi:dienelactone hydrolase
MTQATIQGGHGDLPVYLATPPGPPPWPGVVVIYDAMGMSQDARNQADWLASEGYLTALPDRFAWGSTLTCVQAAFRDMRRRQGRIFEDVEVARDWLVGHSALTAAGVAHDVEEYPAGGHGFLNDRQAGDPIPLMVKVMTPVLGFGPEPASAEDARRRIIEFFGAHLA